MGDTTRIWLDRWGAPRRITDALGQQTKLERTDATFPTLITAVVHPNGFREEAEYDRRGNLELTRQINPYGVASPGPGDDAVTRYEYADSTRWPTFPTRIILPEGEVTQMAYDPNNGNLLSRKPSDDPSRDDITEFHYNDDLQVDSILYPGTVPSERYEYDARGNLWKTISPGGSTARYEKDAIGRDHFVFSPTEDGGEMSQEFLYDLRDRVRRMQTVGPAVSFPNGGSTPAQALIVNSRYDEEGNRTFVSRRSDPSLPRIDSLVTRWDYDRANRATFEFAADSTPADWSDNPYQQSVYDEAGNVVIFRNRRGEQVTTVYDELNRRQSQTLPNKSYAAFNGEIQGVDDALYDPILNPTYPKYPNNTFTFTGKPYDIPGDHSECRYDTWGNVHLAHNDGAKVDRTFYPNGALRTDSTSIRTYAGVFGSHKYGLTFRYDLNGRRESLGLPNQLAPRDTMGVLVGDTLIIYAYNSIGELETIVDPMGNSYVANYRTDGLLAHLSMPGADRRYDYNVDGLIFRDTAGPESLRSWYIPRRLRWKCDPNPSGRLHSRVPEWEIYSSRRCRS